MYVRMYSYAITEDHDFRALGIESSDICIIDSFGPKSVLYYKLCSCVKILQFLLKEVTGEHA